jgi:hypothetical protein
MPTLLRIKEDGLLVRRAMAKQFCPDMTKGQGEFAFAGVGALRLFTHADMLTGPERKLKNKLARYVAQLSSCYVIVTDTDHEADITQLIARAVYWASESYRAYVATEIRHNEDILIDYINKFGGDDDELQAYLAAHIDVIPQDLYPVARVIRTALVNKFDEHFEGSLVEL